MIVWITRDTILIQTTSAYWLTIEPRIFLHNDNRQKRWTMSNISFTQFKHDYNYKLIGEEEARALTDDNLPDRLYAEYVAIINDNTNANK